MQSLSRELGGSRKERGTRAEGRTVPDGFPEKLEICRTTTEDTE